MNEVQNGCTYSRIPIVLSYHHILVDYFPLTYSHFSGMHPGGPGPSHGPPGMMLNRPPMSQAPTMPGKVQSTIKTNIKAGAQVHPYQRS